MGTAAAGAVRKGEPVELRAGPHAVAGPPRGLALPAAPAAALAAAHVPVHAAPQLCTPGIPIASAQGGGLWWPGGSCLRWWPGSQCPHLCCVKWRCLWWSMCCVLIIVTCCAQGHAPWGSKGLHRLHSTSGVGNGHSNDRQPSAHARSHRGQHRNSSPPQQAPGAALQCSPVSEMRSERPFNVGAAFAPLIACNVLQCMLRPRMSSAFRSLARFPSAAYRHRPGLSMRA